MASDLTTYLGNKLIRWMGGNAMPSAPASLWVALYDGNPKSGGTDVTADVNAGGRVQVSFTVPASGSTNTMASSGDVDFGLSDNDVTISHFAVFDASSAGNMLAADALAGGTVDILTGAPVSFTAGNINVTVGSAT
jgi:hypothetical protein